MTAEQRGPEDLGLSGDEWSLVLDAMNGHATTPGMSAQDEIEPNVEDHIRLNRADETWGVDGDALLAKLRGFDANGWAVLMSAVEEHWKVSLQR